MARYPGEAKERRFAAAALREDVERIFTACGMRPSDAGTIAECLVHADLRGIHSHGVLRIPDYVAKLTREGVDPQGRPQVTSRRGGALVIDGNNSMGQIGGRFAMAEAIAAARQGTQFAGGLDAHARLTDRQGRIRRRGQDDMPLRLDVTGDNQALFGCEHHIGIQPSRQDIATDNTVFTNIEGNISGKCFQHAGEIQLNIKTIRRGAAV